MPPKGKPKPSKAGDGEKFNARNYEKPGLSVDEVDEIKEAFDLFDTDNSGAIAVGELTSAMKSLGFDVKNAVVYQMVEELDADGSGEIEFGEFVDIMTARLNEKTSREDINRVFNLFDKDRNGTLEVDDLTRVCQDVGEDVSAEDIREIIQRSDLDGDGAVNMEDFYNVITKQSSY